MSDLQAENKGCWDRVHDLECENGKYFEQIAALQAENERLKKRELELESTIGGVCPEDVSLVEFVESLKKKIADLRADIERLKAQLSRQGEQLVDYSNAIGDLIMAIELGESHKPLQLALAAAKKVLE